MPHLPLLWFQTPLPLPGRQTDGRDGGQDDFGWFGGIVLWAGGLWLVGSPLPSYLCT